MSEAATSAQRILDAYHGRLIPDPADVAILRQVAPDCASMPDDDLAVEVILRGWENSQIRAQRRWR